MKKYLVAALFLCLHALTSSAQTAAPGQVDFTIKTGPQINQVQIFARPAQNYTGKWGQIEVVYGYQTSLATSAPNMVWTTNPALDALFGAAYGVVTNNSVTSTQPTGYTLNITSLQLGVGSTNATVNANTEVLLGTVTFYNGSPSVPIGLFDFVDGGSSGTAQTFITNTTGDYWSPQLGSSSFYSGTSGGGNPAGSTASTDGFANSFAFTNTAVNLPVDLKYFNSLADKCNVDLSWETANEKNFSHFDLEHSTDGKAYYRIATINSKHNPVGSTYAYTDMQATGTGQYRLKMVDLSGDYKYSKVITVRTECGTVASNWNLYPNPSQQGSDVKLQLINGTGVQQVKVVIADLPGRKVAEHTYSVTDGNNVLTMPAGGLLPGTYIVNMFDQQGLPVGTTQKLIVR